jgi:O-antigen ligase
MEVGWIAQGDQLNTTKSHLRTRRLSGKGHFLLVIFLVSLLIPLSINIGQLRLTPYRIVLLILFLPLLVQIFASKAGRVTTTDWLVILYGFWIFISLLVIHGASEIPFAGISVVELLGGYFAGRILVRGPDDYKRVFGILMVALIFLLPFAVLETVTGKLIIPDLLRILGDTPERAWSAYGRMGLERVYSVFDHPILYGLFCTITLANFALIARSRSGIVLAMALALISISLSLSSGPLLAALLQCVLLGWYWIFGSRWKPLIALMIALYMGFVIAADRSLPSFIIEKISFNPMTGWVRLAVFQYGWQSVMDHPIFGIGLGDWVRPSWLTGSVDNFWLLNAMRYGLPGGALIVGVFLSHFFAASWASQHVAENSMLRSAHLIALAATAFTLATVHIWGSLYVFLMFYMGAGGWFYTYSIKEPGSSSQKDQGARTLAYTRFPVRATAFIHGADE